MPVFLNMVDPAEAWRRLAERLRLPDPLPSEEIDVSLSAGRVSARAVTAALSTPAYHGAAMDGFAVHASETRGASEASPVRLKKGEQPRPIGGRSARGPRGVRAIGPRGWPTSWC